METTLVAHSWGKANASKVIVYKAPGTKTDSKVNAGQHKDDEVERPTRSRSFRKEEYEAGGNQEYCADALRKAGERMHRDLESATRVQRAMLPQHPLNTPFVNTAWTYVPTDELAGDALGLHLMDDRYLVFYVVDVSGHGVPAALLAVTAMHELTPTPEGSSLLRDPSG